MPKPQPDKQFHVLCHEHHLEMRMTEGVATYGCPKADCPVRYTVSKGYFFCAKGELDTMPHVMCPHDGRPMYLAEINPEKRAFRLWRCPQCDSSQTNEESLVNAIP